MNCLKYWTIMFGLSFATLLRAQDIAGTWQGTLHSDKTLRIVLQIERDGQGGWKPSFYSIDQVDHATDPRPMASFAFHGGNMDLALDQDAGSYKGKLSSTGSTITGTWTQGKSLPLEFVRATGQGIWKIDSTHHKVQFVTVEKRVNLEVLDWGGVGRSLILLPGLGDTAHVFDKFALKLTQSYHVYGITTRGFGASSAPKPITSNYSADRLGDDVIAVVDALKLDRPILAGHSIAGEELSSVATRHPEKISALIYIDAGYSFALYDKAHGDLVLDSIETRNKLEQLHLGTLPRDPSRLAELMAQTAQLEQGLQQRKDDLSAISPPHPISNSISVAILDGQQRYTQFEVPVLAIFNVPHSPIFLRTMENQVKAFEAQVPQVQVVRIAQADHYVFQSNESEVLSDIDAFVSRLSRP